jgi:hypothetical protein
MARFLGGPMVPMVEEHETRGPGKKTSLVLSCGLRTKKEELSRHCCRPLSLFRFLYLI